jgi:hypothetical protein
VLPCLRRVPHPHLAARSLQSFTQGRSASELMQPEEADALMGGLSAQKAAAAAAAEGESAMADTSVSDEEVKVGRS